MKFLSLLCLILVNTNPSFATVCPEGFKDNDAGGCFGTPSNHLSMALSSRYYCNDSYNSFLYIILNAFQNSQIQNLAITYYADSVWLGLHCMDKSPTSCIWDNGKHIGTGDYSNFAPGQPLPEIGACVYMDVQSGKWFSSDCIKQLSYLGCSYIPQLRVPQCNNKGPETTYINGNCYFPASFSTANKTFVGCQHQNGFYSPGNATSIHSPGENSSIRDWCQLWLWNGENQVQDSYVYIGLEKNTGGRYVWSDGTPSNYLNFGATDNSKNCALMQFGDKGLVKSGQWIPIGCNETPDEGKYSKVWSVCEYPYVEEPPLPPIDCSKPIHVYVNKTNPVVSVYSPGFPLMTSSSMVCTYYVTVPNYKAALDIESMLIDSKSSLKIYDGTPEHGQLLLSCSGGDYSGHSVTASSLTISLVFSTTGQYTNRFQALAYMDKE